MVFTKLSVQEKDAFFGLLDEYFQSRPEIFGQNGDGHGASGLAGSGISPAAAASVVQRALAANATSGPHASATSKSNNPYATNMPNVDVAQAMTVGRVAAASIAFSGGPSSQSQARSTSSLPLSLPSISISPSPKPNEAPPPSLPRRTSPNAPAPASVTPASALVPGFEVDKLVTKKTSVLSAFKKPQTAGVVIPSAFVAPRNAFAPPPVRRVTSETNTGTGGGGGGAQRQGALSHPEPEPESEVHGEWADVVYDYSSEDPGDLAIEAGTRVLVTAKSSEDWWTGQIEGQGKEGLFPASYVKLL